MTDVYPTIDRTQDRWSTIICRIAVMLVVSFALSACMAKPAYLPLEDIPADRPLSAREMQLGSRLYADINQKYPLSDDTESIDRLEQLMDHLSRAAGTDDANWQVHLLNAPDIVDVRAIAGNRIIVWSGLLDIALNDDELAGLLALEIAHDLARHTDPIQFSLATNLLFQFGSLAGSTALMIASQGTVNLGGFDWMKLAYIEARDLGPDERLYSKIEERQAASIALKILQRSDCRPEALIEFYGRTLDEHLDQAPATRLHRRLPPHMRLDILEDLMPNQGYQPTPPKAAEQISQSEGIHGGHTTYPDFR